MLTPKINIVCAISEEFGVEALVKFTEPINEKRYLSMLPLIKRNGPNFCLLADSVSYHTSKEVLAELE